MLADVNSLLMLAVILVAGTAAGSLAKLAHLPSVTGQILAGVLIGPSVVGLLKHENLHAFEPLVDFALGLMAVAVGSHLNFRRLHVARRRLLLLLLLEATLTPCCVFFLLVGLTDLEWYTALLLATIAISTAPATILAIVKETASRGSFVTTLIAAVALNNLACIFLFEVSRTIARAAISPDAANATAASLLVPVGELAASCLLGAVVGLALIFFTRRIVRIDRLSVMSLIAILLTTGLTEELGLSVLMACLSLGITLSNVTPDREEIGHRVFEGFETGIFAIFFTVAGMELDFNSLAFGGILAVLAFVGRMMGKVLAAHFGMKLAGATDRFRRWIGLALTPQAGLAVGLMLLVAEDPAFESISEVFLAVVLATVLLNETVGPILTRMGLQRSGDFGRDRARILDFLSEQNITTELNGPDKESAIRELIDLTVRTHKLTADRDELFKAVMDGEAISCTCVGEGLALPHARLDATNKIIGAMGVSRQGLALGAPDQKLVHCMVLIITPKNMPERHLEVLQALAASIGRDQFIQQKLFHVDSPAHADELIHLDDRFENWNYYLDDDE